MIVVRLVGPAGKGVVCLPCETTAKSPMNGLRGRPAVALVARREITQRVREKSFLVSMAVTVAIVLLVAVVPALAGFGGSPTRRSSAWCRPRAARSAKGRRSSGRG